MNINFKFLLTDCLPETFLGFAILVMLMMPFILKKDISKKMYFSFVLIIFSLIFFVWKSVVGTTYLFNGFFVTDVATHYFKIFSLFSFLFIVISYRENLVQTDMPFEIFVMFLLQLMGVFQAISANDFIILFLGLELMNISLYVTLALKKNSDDSRESVSKYFILSAISSCFILFGISWIYGLTGSTNFTTLERIFEISNYDRIFLTLVAFCFIVIGISFKLLLAPLHFWAPQVYKKLSYFQITLLGVIPKIVFFSVFLKICTCFMHSVLKDWSILMIVLSVISMLLGGFSAFVQTDLRKFVAYSSVGQLGFVFIGFSSIHESGYTDSLMYFSNYILSFIGFITLLGLFDRNKLNIVHLADLKKVRTLDFKWSVFLSLFILNMAGLPPLPGFIFKLHLLNGLILQNQYMQAFVALLYSLISAAYYLKFISILYFSDKKSHNTLIETSKSEAHQKVLVQESSILYIVILGIMVSFILRPDFFIFRFEKVISNLIFY